MRVGFLGGITAFGLLAVSACGSDYGEENPPAGTSSSSGTSGSATSSDAGTDAKPAPSGNGLGATPGAIECGKTTCDLATQICCAKSATDQTCQDKAKACDSPASCDDAADCKTGQKCCGSASGFSSAQTKCVDRCEGIASAQLCRTNEECGAQDCVHQSCYGTASWVCGLNPFCQKL